MALALVGALLAGLVLALLDWSAQPARAQEALIVVNTTADEQNANEQCSLREAIVNANDDDQSGSADCAAGDGQDTIGFFVALSSTITLGSELPAVTDADGLSIEGGRAAPTVSGNDSVRVFFVNRHGDQDRPAGGAEAAARGLRHRLLRAVRSSEEGAPLEHEGGGYSFGRCPLASSVCCPTRATPARVAAVERPSSRLDSGSPLRIASSR